MEKQHFIEQSHIAVERAVDELRRQQGVIITHQGQAFGNFPAEFINDSWLTQHRAGGLQLMLSATRAEALGLKAQAIKINVSDFSLQQINSLYDPLSPLPLPDYTPEPASPTDILALHMAKAAGLLPALIKLSPAENWLTLEADALETYQRHPLLGVAPTIEVSLPVAHAEQARLTCFRTLHGSALHLALIIGDPLSTPAPLVRVHSSCLTGDLLGSLRCDCGDQLQLAIARIAEAGSGVLLYLHQEGRGIGLTNKLRAYKLQEQGIDTYHANRLLGFEEDERDFAIAAAMLKALHLESIRLLTNNPQKIQSLTSHGITVQERIALIAPGGRHNHAYLKAKEDKAGHLF